MSTIEIIQADYSETLTRVAEMGGADLILTSPPYADARTYGAGVHWTMADYQRLGDFVKPALKPGGHCLMVLDAPVREWRKGYGTERSFLPWQVMLDWAERVGLRVPDRLAYGRMGQIGDFKNRFRNDWEPLLWFAHPDVESAIDRWAVAEPSRRANFGGRLRRRGSVEDATYSPASGRAVDEGLTHRGTLWDYGCTGNGHDDQAGQATGHPARFCLRFAEDAVRCFCPPGGLVCDPFTGSGTTPAAAAKHGRRFFGGDLLARPSDGKPWARVALERVSKLDCDFEIVGFESVSGPRA